MDSKADFRFALANRHFMYKYIWRMFADIPDEDMLRVIGSEHTREEITLFAGPDSSLPALHDKIVVYVLARNCIQAIDELSLSYTQLFVGPASLPAPPWESVYRYESDQLFQASTLDVRMAYRAAGYQSAGYPSEADDYLACELDFMAELIADTQNEVNKEEYKISKKSLVDNLTMQRSFLLEHLNIWVAPFAARMEEKANPEQHEFYITAAKMVAEFCKADIEVLEGLLFLAKRL